MQNHSESKGKTLGKEELGWREVTEGQWWTGWKGNQASMWHHTPCLANWLGFRFSKKKKLFRRSQKISNNLYCIFFPTPGIVFLFCDKLSSPALIFILNIYPHHLIFKQDAIANYIYTSVCVVTTS